jgi:hypothetical protein
MYDAADPKYIGTSDERPIASGGSSPFMGQSTENLARFLYQTEGGPGMLD